MEFAGAILDVDGTLMRGDEVIPGAPAGVERIRAADIEPLFVTNNASKRPSAYAKRLSAAGFDVRADQILTAGSVTTSFLRDGHVSDAIYLLGPDGLAEQIDAAGLTRVSDPEAADVVVVSLDKSFDYQDLCDVQIALEDDDVPLYGTDPDIVIPAADRDIPGTGALIRAIAAVSGREPDAIFGKPNRALLTAIFDRYDHAPGECFVVGDRIATDIALGQAVGMTTVLVLSGSTDENERTNSMIEPDYVLDSLAEIDRVLDH